jgi:hypothetical protein
MPKWMERIEKGMREGGVDEPYALMNSMGIKEGSKTVVGKEEAHRRMSSYGRRQTRKRKLSAGEAGDAMADSKRG